MKRLLACVLALIMLLSIPVFSSVAEQEKITIKAMTWSTGDYTDWFNAFFELHPEWAEKFEIEWIIGGEHPQDVVSQVRLMLAANNAEEMPDIYCSNYMQLPEFAEIGLFYDFKEEIAPYEDDIIPAVKELMKYEGTYIGFPREMKSKVWFYRKDIFAEAGIVPDEVKTIDELIAAGKKIQELYPDSYIECYGVPMMDYDLMMVASGLDARISDENGEYVIGTDPGFRKAFEYFKKMRDSGVATTKFIDFSADWDSAFADGTMVSELTGAWFKHGLSRRGEAGKWGCALWPEEIRYGSDCGAALITVLDSSPYKKELAEMLTTMYFDPPTAAAMFDLDGVIMPPYSYKARDLIDIEHTSNTFFGEELVPNELASYEYLKMYPYTVSTSKELLIMNEYLNQYLSGTLGLDEALMACENDLKMQIGNSLNPF